MTKVQEALDAARRESFGEDISFRRAALAARKTFNGAKLTKASADGHGLSALILHLLSEDKPLGRGERRTLAELLAGELHTIGRPATKAVPRQAYRELIDETKASIRTLRKVGRSPDDAKVEAIAQASRDPRARGKALSTIERDLDRARQ